jgi:uncharacterized protein (TIGR03085 family)
LTHFAREERRTLADLLRRVGPDAPTLCEGWTAADLAAHLVLRERRPDAAAGILVPALAGYTERVQQSIRDGRGWPELVAAVESGPPLPIRLLRIDDAVNTPEYFIHIEDVRRAEVGWQPRDLDPGVEQALWRRIRLQSRLARRAVRVGLVLDAPGFGRVTVRPGHPGVTVTGPPSEILLFLSGRQSAARIAFDGPADAVDQVRGANFRL